MYLLLLHLFFVTNFTFSFNVKQPFISNRILTHRILSNRIARYNYNGNNDNKLRKIDEALNNEKNKLKQLLTEKNKIMQNITGLNLHNETFIQNCIENVFNDICKIPK